MENFTKIEDIDVRYLKLGDGENLILLHGIWSYSETYLPLLKMLSEKYTVYAPDLPGFGKTSKPNNTWSFEDYSEFLYKFIKKLNLKKFVLVAHSGSGGIAIIFSDKYSRFVKKLVLISSFGIDRVSYFTFLKAILIKSLKELSSLRGLVALKSIITGAVYNFFNYGDYILSVIHKNKDKNLIEHIRNIKVDTLLLWAKNDEYFPLSHAKKFNKLIKKSELKIINGNHDLCLMYPEKIGEFM